jgi:predicted Fe-S protein YdhL (DUF1289 family)
MGTLADLDDIFARLARSAFRQRFTLATREREYMRVRGKETVLAHARVFIAHRLAPAHPAKDGKQTPFRGHPAFLAQHATATCCRGCLAKWHGIPAGRVMTVDEREYVVSTIERWLDMQAAGDRPDVQQSLQLL